MDQGISQLLLLDRYKMANSHTTSVYVTPMISPITHDDFTFSFRADGGIYETVQRNKKDLQQIIGRPVCILHQIHSKRVIDLDLYFQRQDADHHSLEESLQDLASCEADGMVTSQKNYALGILTADCVPIIFADIVHNVYGACHSGRRGTELNIAGEVVNRMVDKGAETSSIVVWIGPHICGHCYETGTDIAHQFASFFPHETSVITQTCFGGEGIDLEAAILNELHESNIAPHNIHTQYATLKDQSQQYAYQNDATVNAFNATCTLENPALYSYRQYTLTNDKHYNGRFLTLVVPHEDELTVQQ